MANCIFRLVVLKCRSWFASVSKPLVRVKCVADRWFVVCRCVVSFRVSCAHRMESDVHQTHSHRPAAQCYLPHGPIFFRKRSHTPDHDCGSVGVAAGANVAADAVATLNCASRHPRVPTVSRTSAHSSSARGVATRAPLYLYKGLSFLLTLMFLVLRRKQRRINRVYQCSTASFTVV